MVRWCWWQLPFPYQSDLMWALAGQLWPNRTALQGVLEGCFQAQCMGLSMALGCRDGGSTGGPQKSIDGLGHRDGAWPIADSWSGRVGRCRSGLEWASSVNCQTVSSTQIRCPPQRTAETSYATHKMPSTYLSTLTHSSGTREQRLTHYSCLPRYLRELRHTAL